MATNKRLIKSNDEAAGGASFNTVLYTGNGTTLPITGVGFQPDLVWLKRRDAGYPYTHKLIDSVRGATIRISSEETGPDITEINGLKSFDSDGFTLGGDGGYNINGAANVAWCWKAGGAAVTNTDGTITSQVSANTEAGFSIVSYTGNGSDYPTGASIGHGLSSQPKIIIVKDRTNTGTSWAVLPVAVSDSTAQTLLLDYDFALSSSGSANAFNQQLPTSSVFYVGQSGGGARTNGASSNYIAYCFAEVAGFSKFGSYVGNRPNGVIVNTVFEPAFVLVKKTDSIDGNTDWILWDNKRDTSNPIDSKLSPNTSSAEFTSSTMGVDFNTNGFEIKGTDPSINLAGSNYIYMAFANQF